MIITSDHAGHDTVHGSQHPDDFRLPLVIVSDKIQTDRFQDRPYRVTDLKSILEHLLGSNA
ncbi:MAG: hypothetical protein AB7S77_04930 [Desulfatirhabdiaceae bacterium]